MMALYIVNEKRFQAMAYFAETKLANIEEDHNVSLNGFAIIVFDKKLFSYFKVHRCNIRRCYARMGTSRLLRRIPFYKT